MAISEGWSYKDIPDFYNRVRALLDNISDVSLPDKYMDMQEKAPAAMRYAQMRTDGWSNLGEGDFEIFQSAIVYKTASMFENLGSSKAIKKKKLPTITLEYFERKSSFVKMNGMTLSDIADSLLSELNDDVGTGFIGFMVT